MSYTPVDALDDLMAKLKEVGFSLQSTPDSPAFEDHPQQLCRPDGRVRFYEHNDLEEPALDAVDFLIWDYKRLKALHTRLTQALQASPEERAELAAQIARRDLREGQFIASERKQQLQEQRLKVFRHAFEHHDLGGLRDIYVVNLADEQVEFQGDTCCGTVQIPGAAAVQFAVTFAEGAPTIEAVSATQDGQILGESASPAQDAPRA